MVPATLGVYFIDDDAFLAYECDRVIFAVKIDRSISLK